MLPSTSERKGDHAVHALFQTERLSAVGSERRAVAPRAGLGAPASLAGLGAPPSAAPQRGCRPQVAASPVARKWQGLPIPSIKQSGNYFAFSQSRAFYEGSSRARAGDGPSSPKEASSAVPSASQPPAVSAKSFEYIAAGPCKPASSFCRATAERCCRRTVSENACTRNCECCCLTKTNSHHIPVTLFPWR